MPLRYAVDLRVDPAQPRFSGQTAIQVDVTQPTFYVVLNARDMNVTRAFARVGVAEVPATWSSRVAHGGAGPEELVLSFSRPLPAGKAAIVVVYDAPFAGDLEGLYRVQEGGAWYAYTQFEATDARRAFPCFDEPGFKTPYDLTIAAPRGQIVVANAPEDKQDDAADGTVVHHFATSKPMPSYLVAFAVGDFDLVPGQSEPFPIRAITTKGKGALTSMALEATVALVAKLGDYFDIRYPYDKLDIVAVPDFAAGAMENPGLITFRDVFILLDPHHATTSDRREQALVIAHELSHQWFGDLVTMAWWNDLWLNEGFRYVGRGADGRRVAAHVFGAARIEQISGVQYVMDTDALATTRAVREDTRSSSDVMEAFDGITYQKGAAVLRMLERWLGPDTFQRGVQRYIHEHAWGNARAEDLFKAMEFVSTQKVGDLASGFVDQTGVPSVQASWTCGSRAASLEAAGVGVAPPGRARASGAQVDAARVRRRGGPAAQRVLFTVGAEPIERDLGAQCPAWVYPNAEEAGYYRFLLDKTQPSRSARGASSAAGDRPPGPRVECLGRVRRQGRLGAGGAARRAGALRRGDQPLRGGADLERAARARGRGDRRRRPASVPALRGSAVRRAQGVARVGAGQGRQGGRRSRPRAADRAARDGRGGARRGDARRGRAHDAPVAQGPGQRLGRRRGGVRSRWRAAARGARRAARDELRGRRQAKAAAVARGPRARDSRDGRLRRPGDAAARARRGVRRRAAPVRAHVLPALGARPARGDGDVLRLAWSTGRTRATSWPTEERWLLVAAAGRMCTVAERDDAKAFLTTATEGLEGTKRWLDEGLEEAGLCAALRERRELDVARYFSRR